jgi:hypothetical protein
MMQEDDVQALRIAVETLEHPRLAARGHKSCLGHLPQALIKGPQAFSVQLFSRRCGKFAITNDVDHPLDVCSRSFGRKGVGQ